MRKGGEKGGHYHDASKGVSDEMDPSFVAEVWIVAAPQSINAVCLRDKCGYHLGLVVGHVKWDIEHDI